MTKDKALNLALEFVEANHSGGPDAFELITTIKQALATPVQEPLSFNCSAGCGACGVKLQDFVTHQTQAQEGDEWVVVDTEPQIVSTCCGSPVEVWDERKQNITASVDATPPNVATPLAAQPAPVQEPVAWMRKWAFDGEVPAKVKNDAGRWHWPTKFKLMPITENQCLMDDVPLYTAPPPRQPLTDEQAEVWVTPKLRPLAKLAYERKPLSDEEIKRMAAKWFLSMYWPICNTFAREIEAAHGIKGEA